MIDLIAALAFASTLVATLRSLVLEDRANRMRIAERWFAYADMALEDGRGDFSARAERVASRYVLSACGVMYP